MDILVDTNVLLDIFTRGDWFKWSSEALAHHLENDSLFINPIIYAEVSTRFETIEELDEELPSSIFRREPLPWAAGFLAARAFRQYRSRGGSKHSTLSDFYIGAHATVEGMSLLTRDAGGYRTYFPKLKLITPR